MGIIAVDEIALREPRLLVPRRTPMGLVKLDPNHPLRRWIAEALICVPGKGLWDLVRNQWASQAGVTKVSNHGPYFNPTSAGSYGGSYDLDNAYNGGTVDCGTLLQHVNINNTNDYKTTFYMYAGPASGFGYWYLYLGNPLGYLNNVGLTPMTGIVKGTSQSIVTKINGANGNFHIDGAYATGTSSASTAYGSMQLLWATHSGLNGGAHFVVFMPSIDIGDAAAQSLSADPYQLVIPA